jgi:hypothetical protein
MLELLPAHSYPCGRGWWKLLYQSRFQPELKPRTTGPYVPRYSERQQHKTDKSKGHS